MRRVASVAVGTSFAVGLCNQNAFGAQSCSAFTSTSMIGTKGSTCTSMRASASTSNASRPPVPVPEKAPAKSSEKKSGGGDGDDLDWTEPNLADLDRSIPQVDCKFIADIVNMRNLEKDSFLEDQEQRLRTEEELRAQREKEAEVDGTTEKARLAASGGKVVDEEPEEMKSMLGKPLQDARQHLEDTQNPDFRYRPEYEDGFVIIDCRTVDEVTSWGMIEGAKLLPAHDLFEGMHMGPDEFFDNFGFPKPQFDDKIIFYCMYGPRSLMAAQIASWMGYESVMHLQDGYYEWAKQYNLLVRRWREHDKTSGNNDRRLATFQLAKELAREVAPEFNNLIEAEASQYRLDHTRSRGKMLVGETVLEKAKRQITERKQKFIESGGTLKLEQGADGPEKLKGPSAADEQMSAEETPVKTKESNA